jgi:hypothetical protein
LAVDRIIRSTDQFLGVWSKNFDQVIRSSEIRSSDPLSWNVSVICVNCNGEKTQFTVQVLISKIGL